jgi:hypothetical protein
MQFIIGLVLAFALPAGFVTLWWLDYKEDKKCLRSILSLD